MDVKEKREELVKFFRQQLINQTEELKTVDESQKELVEAQMEKTYFSLQLMEEGSVEHNGQKIELTDKRVELMFKNYFQS